MTRGVILRPGPQTVTLTCTHPDCVDGPMIDGVPMPWQITVPARDAGQAARALHSHSRRHAGPSTDEIVNKAVKAELNRRRYSDEDVFGKTGLPIVRGLTDAPKRRERLVEERDLEREEWERRRLDES